MLRISKPIIHQSTHGAPGPLAAFQERPAAFRAAIISVILSVPTLFSFLLYTGWVNGFQPDAPGAAIAVSSSAPLSTIPPLVCLGALLGVLGVYFLWVLLGAAFHKSSLVLSLLLSAMFMLGLCQHVSSNLLFRPNCAEWWASPMMYGFVALFLYALIEAINSLADRRKPRTLEKPLFSGHYWVLCLILILGWLPHYLVFFPGSVMNDTLQQLRQYYGYAHLSDNNPVFLTFLYGKLLDMGKALFHNDNYAVATAVAIQLVCMALAFSYVATTLRRVTGSWLAEAVLVALFYLITPIYGGASQVLLKDTINLYVFAAWLAVGLNLYLQPHSEVYPVVYALLFLAVPLSRKGGQFYSLVGGAAMVLYLLCKRVTYPLNSIRRNREGSCARRLGALLLISLACYFCFENVLLPRLEIWPAPTSENYSVMYQQVAFVAREHYDELTEEERGQIESVLDLEAIVEIYDPNIADPVKATYHSKTDIMQSFFRVYLSWWVKYPKDMIKALLTSYWRYVYPFLEGVSYYRHYQANFREIGMGVYYMTSESLRLQAIDFLDNWWVSSLLPTMLVSCGLYSWMLLFGLARLLRNRQFGFLAPLTPAIVAFIGLFITHVNGEIRYAYPVIVSGPFVALLSLSLPPIPKPKKIEEPEEA